MAGLFKIVTSSRCRQCTNRSHHVALIVCADIVVYELKVVVNTECLSRRRGLELRERKALYEAIERTITSSSPQEKYTLLLRKLKEYGTKKRGSQTNTLPASYLAETNIDTPPQGYSQLVEQFQSLLEAVGKGQSLSN